MRSRCYAGIITTVLALGAIFTSNATAQEISDTRTRKSAYSRAFILNPGRYRVDVIVRDIQTEMQA